MALAAASGSGPIEENRARVEPNFALLPENRNVFVFAIRDGMSLGSGSYAQANNVGLAVNEAQPWPNPSP